MTRSPSLALRLALYLFATQVIAALVTTLGIELFVEDDAVALHKNRNELATPRINNMLLESLRVAADGKVFIQPSPSLLSEMSRNPTTMVAAFYPRTGEPLEGSSPVLADALSGMQKIRTSHLHFRLAEKNDTDLVGHMSTANTPFGPLSLASYGHHFEWIDIFLSLHYEMTTYVRYFLLAALLAIFVAWIGFKRGLAPLDKVAREAERIDLDSLHQRLPLAGVPLEATPLVFSMNKVLERLDDGAERQRRFLANAAHELRTPVAILMERLDEAGDSETFVKLRRDAERIRSIVEQLLAGFRLERKENRGDEKCEIGELVETIVDDHALLAVKMGKGIAFEKSDEKQMLNVDRFALQSVLANLIQNALRAEPEGGTIVVSIENGGQINVVDHGEGVPEEEREMIFEPFWRKNPLTPGTGLGLAIARDLIVKLGGAIRVETTPGGGAIFCLALPTTKMSDMR